MSAAFLFVGCTADPSTMMDPDKPDRDPTKGTYEGKGEAWGSADSPSIFNQSLEYRFASLPESGQATNIPWASSYWPVYEDSINYKWEGSGTDSSAKKYEKAFGGTGVEDAVSRYHGIDGQTGRKECTSASDCSDLKDGSTCAKRTPDAAKGRCIPTWWGICHAWTPAAILNPEPKRPVTKNGVTFKVNDIKALVTLVHNSTSAKSVSLRCDKDNTDGLPDSSTIHFDDYGRPVDGDRECRDSNAGTYHVLLANYLGIKHEAFAEDRTNGAEVWNQPLRAFRVTSKEEVTAAQANTLIGVTTTGGTKTEQAATVKKDAWQHYPAMAIKAGQAVKVVMSGSGDADLYVSFGAQPTDAAYACRPYGDDSNETCDLTAQGQQNQVFISVKGYAETSDVKLSISLGGSAPTAYVFNANAVKFFRVKSEVDYIGESSSSTDGNLSSRIDSYTHTDHYDYILEIDAGGKIVGGEWLGSSKRNHPDFLWLPLAARGSSVAGGKITYAQVKALLDESVADVMPPGPGGTVKTVEDAGAIAKGAWKQYGPYNLAAGATLTATLAGDGDADLYVRKAAAPTSSAYDCRPYTGNTNESCSIVGPAQVYVAVNGYAATSNYRLKVVYTEAGGDTPPPPPPPPPSTFTHLDQSGSVAQGEMKIFELPIPAGKKVVLKTTSSADVDLYIQMGAAPTTTAYLARGYTSSGNETITYTATSNGTLFVGVHGYEAAAFTVKTSDM